jgi:REP element-mobilizing transposase RayT
MDLCMVVILRIWMDISGRLSEWTQMEHLKNNYITLIMTNLPQRTSPRRKDYDYGSSWCYFVTICTQDRIHFLADDVGAGLALTDSQWHNHLTDFQYTMRLTDIGSICDQEIKHMISLRPDLEMWEYVIMPNHIHLLFSFGSITKAVDVWIDNKSVEASHDPTQAYHNQTLSSIIWSLKSAVTRVCNKQELKHSLWSFARQRSFHDHIVRNQQEFDAIKYYIQTNPQNREDDSFNK